MAHFRRIASLFCLILGGCTAVQEERRPGVTLVSGSGLTLAEPSPIISPAPLPAPVAPIATTPAPASAPVPVPTVSSVPAAPTPVLAAPPTARNPAPFQVTPPVPTPAPAFAPAVPLAAAPSTAPSLPPVLPAPPAPPPSANGAPSPARSPGPGPERWISLDHWAQAHGRPTLLRTTTAATPTYTLATTNGILTLHIGSLAARWNGVEFRLGFAPQLIDGHASVHPLDARKHLEPLLNGTLAGNPNPVIVIDPGHGGTDAGSKSAFDGGLEKDYTLDWARRVQGLLIARGWTALLTRNGDANAALSNRVAFAEQHQADLFLSLHFNSAAPNHAEAGLETYCLTPAGLPSSLTRGYRDDIALTFPNNEFDAQNLQYALRLQRAVLQVNGHVDRGVRHARFLTVLQGQNRPAVLVEGGYLSNPQEARRIADPNYRQKLAEAVAVALGEAAGRPINFARHSSPLTPAPAAVLAAPKIN